MAMPTKMTVPISAPRIPVTAVAAGCGGTMQWITCNETSRGTPTFIFDIPAFFATTATRGTINKKPTSEKTGMPTTKPITAMTQGAL
ncbi:hypothetical protein D3C84_821280 [compost metagenome]